MATLYEQQISQEEGDVALSTTIQVGTKRMYVKFQWATASEEQFNLIQRYLNTKAMNDPLVGDGGNNTEYDYLTYYLNAYVWLNADRSRTVDDWIRAQGVLPRSVLASDARARATLVQGRIDECVALAPVVRQYMEILRWHFTLTYNGHTTVGVVEPGGWYRNQDREFSFRFVSDRSSIGKNDLGLVKMEFEVYD